MKNTQPLKSEGGRRKPASGDFLIVGIGASAGGIQALKEFFEAVAADSGMAYVVILHLSPDHESRLAEVLQQSTPLPVRQVTKRVRVEPNHVYVVPQNKHLTMTEGDLTVSPNISTEERRAPVDIFFRTLADSHQARAVAVILSGTGANGSMGLKRIKELGGVCFVQNPREAEFSEMPRNAIATELVDRVLNVAEIPAQITAYKESLGTIEIPVEPQARPEEQQQALREIFTQLRLRTGHDFSNYKRATVLRRIERRINVRHLQDLSDYAKFVRENHDETNALLKDLLISVTNFFRDKPAFDYLAGEVLPKIFAGKTAEDEVRIWAAGCATGEEAYSLAMLCAEQTFDAADAPGVQIFATDIDEQAIRVARNGFYSLNDAADVSPERLRRFFIKEADGYRIRRELREMILFAGHNVLKDPPFSRLDLATCRNLLIYLNQTAQERVMETLHFALNPGGYLFLGNSETVAGAGDLYAPVSREHHVYQSRQISSRIVYPVAETSPRSYRFGQSNALLLRLPEQSPAENRAGVRISSAELHLRLLEKFTPSIVVNEEYDIVHSSESAVRFLQFQGGEPTRNLLKLIHPEIRIELRTALYQAVEQRTNVEIKNLKINTGERDEAFNVYVRPSIDAAAGTDGFILVLFEAARTGEPEGEQIAHSPAEPAAGQLEAELVSSKTRLRSVIEQYDMQAEELKASNEELQAMNEEMRSATEELETGKEELQSVNEELVTVNQELKIKIEELSNTNDDFRNLINSTDIAVIFLDRLLKVNSFTPAATRIFNLLAADYGRPLSDITNNLEDDRLEEIAGTVLETLQAREREIRTADGRVYLERVLPYRTTEDRINGVVLTFTDITDRKHADEARFFLAAIVESSGDSMVTVNFDSTITSWNKAAERLYGYPASEVLGKPLTILTLPADLAEVLSNIRKVQNSQKVEIYDTVRVRKSGREINLEIVLSPVKDDKGQVIGVSTIARDVTERRKAESALREKEAMLAAVFEALPVGVGFTDTEGRLLLSNREMLRFLPTGIVPSRDAKRVSCWHGWHSDGRPLKSDEFASARALKGEKVVPGIEMLYTADDNSEIWTQVSAVPVNDNEGRIIGQIAVVTDIDVRKRAEEALRRRERELETIINRTPFLLTRCGRDLHYKFVSRAYAEIAGKTPEEIAGKPIRDVLTEEAFQTILPHVQKVLAGERAEFESKVSYREDGERWLHVIYNPDRNDAGEVIGWIASILDITGQKKAEDELRASHERITEIIESIGDAFYAVDDDWRFIFINGKAEQIWGRSRDRLLGRNIWEVFPEAVGSYPYKELQRAFNERVAVEFEARSPVLDYWIEVSAYPAQTGGLTVYFRDISARKQAEEAVRESEERFRLFVTASSDTLYKMSADWTVMHSLEGKDFLADARAPNRTWLEEYIPESDKPQVRAAINEAIREKKIFELEHRVVRADGSLGWTFSRAVPMFDAAGEIIEWFGAASDITDRKEAEKALRESEERYVLATQAVEAVIYDWNLIDDRIIRSHELENLLGFSPAEKEVQTNAWWKSRLHPDDAQRAVELVRERIDSADECFTDEYRIRHRDGHYVWVSDTGVLLRDENGTAIRCVGSVRNITGQKEAETAVRRSEERLRLLIESTTDYAIFTMTADGVIDSWNTGAEKMFGWTEAEAVGQPGEIIFTPEDRKNGVPEKELQTALSRGRAPDERFHLRKDGTRFYVSGIATVLKDQDEQIGGVVKIARDMTTSRKAEKTLRDKELLQKLVGAQEEERLRIARDLHDELGQQLTALRLKLEKARRMCKEDAAVCAEIDQIDLIAKSIDDGVDFLAWELRPAALDQFGLISALENYVRQWSHHSGVRAELLISSLKKRRFARDVETNLYRIVQEALNNVHKHARASRAEVLLEKRGDLIVLIIQDDGRGFNVEDKMTRNKGIGLIGMEERAALIQGALEIESAPGEGTTVFVRVPVSSGKKKGSHEK